MSNIPGTTRLQTKFLRSFLRNPAGPPPQDWPAPALLRRWLRRPTFRQALDSLRETLAYQADFHLAYAATTAAQTLSPDNEAAKVTLLKLHHLRQRFAAKPDPQPPTPDQVITQERLFFRRLDPNAKVGEALSFFERRTTPKEPTR